jgi:ATP/maltotriose-dependent transcriptional regulator MalT
MSIYPRERITEALQDSVNRGVAMLIAPAGFGKSEAATDAFGASAHWIYLPEDGATAETIARLLIDKVSPRSIRALSAHLARPQTEENLSHLAEWCSARLRSVESPIVFEDFQHLSGDLSSLRFVRQIIEATVPNIRWVIISRETPELPVGTWLARDYMLLPVTAEDLSFEVSESADIARALQVTIDDTSIRELVTDVGGWPLAVRLSLGAWERTRALPSLRIRTRRVLFEFIEEQVWSHLAADDQRLCEAAAHLSDLRPRILGAAGFPESRLTLERLHLRLPLLSRIGNGNFKLHELFREFILERSEADPERHSALVARLARALERFGDIDGAIAMHIRAEAWDSAISLLTRHGIDRIENGHRSDVLVAINRFPRSYRDHPVITGLRGFALSIDGAYAVAKREIEKALEGDIGPQMRGALILQSATLSVNVMRPKEAIGLLRGLMVDEHAQPSVRLNAAASLAVAAAMAGETTSARDAIGFCSSALDAGSVEVRAIVSHRLAYAHWCLGEPMVAEGYATESVQLAHSLGLEAVAARAYSILQGVAAAIYPDTLLSRRYAEACARSAVAAGDRSMQIHALECQLAIASDQGDDELYEASERRLIELGAERSARNVMWLHYAKLIRIAGRGNETIAASLLSSVDVGGLSAAERVFRDALLGLMLANSKRDEATALLGRTVLVTAESDIDSRRLLAYAQVYHSLGQWLLGRGRAARRAPNADFAALTPRDSSVLTVIGTICSTSRQTTTARQLAQLTEPLLALQLDGHARFLRRILAPATVTQLTRTELEVLRALRTGGTTADVADRLGRSSHTILSHLKSACSKIGCSGRAAAVAYAEDMGWLE